MSATVRPFLMFEGRAEEAMNFYVSLFPDGKIADIAR
jgi:predicted 3-demethylubiquinone-9 3-methyltransferase (glyoxalase superfamily)